jgi:hypothetical protein
MIQNWFLLDVMGLQIPDEMFFELFEQAPQRAAQKQEKTKKGIKGKKVFS